MRTCCARSGAKEIWGAAEEGGGEGGDDEEDDEEDDDEDDEDDDGNVWTGIHEGCPGRPTDTV